MIRLEDIQPNATISGIIPNGYINVINVKWYGSEALEITYKTSEGNLEMNSYTVTMNQD